MYFYHPQAKPPSKNRVFNVPLQNLQLTDAILVNGGVVQVPHFISDACQRILDHADTEGIFRKAGSAQRLKEIRAGLESGKPISRNLNVIDLGDVLKSFFRDLPEPLLAPGMCQEMMLRCILLPGEERKKALLLTCLLLPPVTLSTLSFFMQFLHKIASQSQTNRMTAQNLAIVFTPSLMPLTDHFNSVRLQNHVKVIEYLINYSTEIGVVPEDIMDRLSVIASTSTQQDANRAKSKKRRSNSMTRFCVNGLKKIVNNVRRDSVENNLDGAEASGSVAKGSSMGSDLNHISQTPLLTTKKRKHIEIASMAESIGFSAKKKYVGEVDGHRWVVFCGIWCERKELTHLFTPSFFQEGHSTGTSVHAICFEVCEL